ncbi:MAG: hypothetical protein C0496_09910 [Erythrobacter sp.]|nr:hypothetical protein [Erythrobacter sp.]
MKAYGIFPRIDVFKSTDPRAAECHDIVTQMVCDCLRAGGDVFHVAIDWHDPDGEAWSMCTEGIARPEVVHLDTREKLFDLVHLSLDPNANQGAAVIRSMATCRAATFGYDGQAFICLRHEDDPPVSPAPDLVEVAEDAGLLTETDYLDGVIISPPPD